MTQDSKTKTASFTFFPQQRLATDFSWPVWAAGWLAIFKALTWLATDPNIPDVELHFLGIKYLAFMVPFIVFGIGTWNLRKWGCRGLIVMALADLAFFVIHPTVFSSLELNRTSLLSTVLSIIIFFINGPLSDILILFAGPAMLRHSGKSS